MYLTDLHTHSILSPDGYVPLAEMACAAVNAGFSAMTITDHFDMLDIGGNRVLTYNWGPALAQYQQTLPQFKNRLKLGLGLELGSIHVSPRCALSVLNGAGDALDMVIGSIHNYREENGGGEYYFGHFNSLKTCHETLEDYFTSMEELVANPDCYDVLGHIIYPLRYMHRDGQNISLKPYRDRLAGILRTVIDTGRSIEVNTCRGKTVEDWREIIKLYHDLGGTLITTGSDAHRSTDFGKGIRESYRLLQSCGFEHITVYTKRKPERVKI